MRHTVGVQERERLVDNAMVVVEGVRVPNFRHLSFSIVRFDAFTNPFFLTCCPNRCVWRETESLSKIPPRYRFSVSAIPCVFFLASSSISRA